jgi:hypothetical protein
MRGRWLVLLMVPQWLTAAPDAPDVGTPHELIEQCALRADAGLHGLDTLRTVCPEVDSAAARVGLDALLSSDWRARINVGALNDLDALAQRYAAPMPHATPDSARLRAIAKALEPPAAPVSWWERFKAWIAHWLKSNNAKWPHWLRSHWSLSDRFWNTLAYVLAASIVLAALVVAVLEVRAARVRGRPRRRNASRRYAAEAEITQDSGSELSAIERAPLHQRAALVLRLLVGALTRSQRLARDRNLTCRELITAARFDSAAQRDQFRSLALLAERALYGQPPSVPATEVSPGTREPDLDSVKELYEGLLATPVEAPPVRP